MYVLCYKYTTWNSQNPFINCIDYICHIVFIDFHPFLCCFKSDVEIIRNSTEVHNVI